VCHRSSTAIVDPALAFRNLNDDGPTKGPAVGYSMTPLDAEAERNRLRGKTTVAVLRRRHARSRQLGVQNLAVTCAAMNNSPHSGHSRGHASSASRSARAAASARRQSAHTVPAGTIRRGVHHNASKQR
jgi:hypothetical protein